MYELYTHSHNSNGGIYVSLRRSGQIGFSKDAANLLKLCDTYACLYYDSDANMVKIELWKDIMDEGAHKVTACSGNVYIVGKGFCERFHIPLQKARKFRPIISDGTVEIKLDEAM